MTQCRSIRDLATPALLLNWPSAHRNIVRASKLVGAAKSLLRPHFKSHKCVPLARAQLAAGNCTGMTVATTDEATALLRGGIKDLLLANGVAGSANLDLLMRRAKRGCIRVAVDSYEAAQALSARARRGQPVGRVLVGLELGRHRWGVAPGAPAVELAQRVAALPGLRFDGLQAYHGSCAHIRNAAERRQYARATMESAIATRNAIEAAGLPCPIVSGGGTGTFQALLKLRGITEFQLGSYVLMDWAFQERMGPVFEIALEVAATVIHVSKNQLVINVGLKGLGNKAGPPRFPELRDYQVVQFHAEEHTLVRAPGHKLRVGEPIRVIPSHAGGTVNLYRQFVVHDGDEILDRWPISATGYEHN